MTDKRNIVIKVKYPVSGKEAEKFTPKMVTIWNIKRILVAAGVLVFIVAGLIYVFIKDPQESNAGQYQEENTPDNAELVINLPQENATLPVEIKEPEIKKDISQKLTAKANTKNKPENEPNKKNRPISKTSVKSDLKKQVSKQDINDRRYSKVNNNVTRAVLTYSINNKEPAGDEVTQAVEVDGKKPTWVYYFTELKSMNGSKVYHEWLKNGVLDSRKELNISGDAWRTSSRKLFADTEKGNWTVRLVDEHGQLLNEKSFKVD